MNNRIRNKQTMAVVQRLIISLLASFSVHDELNNTESQYLDGDVDELVNDERKNCSEVQAGM